MSSLILSIISNIKYDNFDIIYDNIIKNNSKDVVLDFINDNIKYDIKVFTKDYAWVKEIIKNNSKNIIPDYIRDVIGDDG